MLIARLIGFFVLVALAVSLFAYFWTRNRRYMRFASRLVKATLIAAFVFALFYVIERLLLVA